MSLQLWMPLMGDLRNQGLGNYSISTLGTISWVTGKLGAQALKAGVETQTVNGLQLNSNLCDLLNGNYSISVWLKPYGKHVHYNGSVMSSGNWNTANKRWAFGVSQDNSKVDVLCMNYNTYIACTVPVNEWTHIICIRGDDDIVKLYKNGEYVGERNCASDPSFASDANVTCIGRESYASGYFSFNGAIQDLRLYDHCLSPIEIKQLSQGLVLHYLLNNTFPNLINLDTIENDKYFLNTTYSTTSKWCATDFISVYPNTSYIGQGFSNGGSNTYVAIFDKNKVATRSVLITAKQDVNLTTTGNEYFVRLSLRQFENEYLTATFKQVSNIEYDISGFCNNGTRIGTFSWTSDTPKYAVSSVHTGSNYIYLDSPPTETQTIAVWAKWNTIPSGQSVILVDNGSGIGLGLMSTGILCSTSKAGNSYTFSKANLVANTWYHFVIVKTGATTRKLYINGVEQTATSNVSNWTYSVNQLQLGKRSTTSDGFAGKLCDFRAYATALSAEDVKSLYQNCATIDPDGTIRGQIRS